MRRFAAGAAAAPAPARRSSVRWNASQSSTLRLGHVGAHPHAAALAVGRPLDRACRAARARDRPWRVGAAELAVHARCARPRRSRRSASRPCPPRHLAAHDLQRHATASAALPSGAGRSTVVPLSDDSTVHDSASGWLSTASCQSAMPLMRSTIGASNSWRSSATFAVPVAWTRMRPSALASWMLHRSAEHLGGDVAAPARRDR